MSKTVFLDRDGVINKKLENDYVKSISEFEILEGVKIALQKLKELGYLLVVITNQQGIGKGIMSEKDLLKVHEHMLKELPEIDDIFYCPHLNGTCNCRKPENKMLYDAKEKLDIDFNKSWMIGDSKSDILCGKSVGCKTIMICDNLKQHFGDFMGKNLVECVEIIEKNR
ncbi:D-glycero-alpha-D-manno-heptose-1,7-bisphosphate 7-phosphatase [Methanococcus maripaludis]|uniref:D,D-heptose 1,7-bisphosphate phosphatase n=1 Tax=Methanococcus maripaludis TaxID=39152 RepID=A0A2L1CCN4_METMI|nr:HAD family hydrolase [Methanococcus maripaludis]AVB77138.1 D-glycero-beta-D-manno-heptose-1,7-bisphosphate 7-phosphatase [Methanococcus maripaludis]MBA2863649.1 D-glycero-D-manno-heptose 1,7-bisphosphate phosphatase [Methanococcus maripaludis]MBB6496345.1 D-glycero-D-manno-heptose 1,7-bisphosphate phosphatase [Methanococcus maripaludis]